MILINLYNEILCEFGIDLEYISMQMLVVDAYAVASLLLFLNHLLS
jgi:hypothetical protein